MEDKNYTLITGSTGFLGSNILRMLKNKNLRILAGYNNKKNLIKAKNVIPIKFQIENFAKQKIIKYKISNLIHLAWPNLDNFTDIAHKKKILNNQKNFIENMVKNGCKNLIIAGTCYEYGLINGKIKESKRTKPSCSYGYGKDSLRKYVFKLKKKYRFKLTWLRIFYIYGKNPNRNTLFNRVLNSKKTNQYIILNNKIRRDYVNIDFVAKVFVKILSKNKDNGIVNLSSGKKISLKKLMNILKFEYNIDAIVKYKNTKQRIFEPESFYGDNNKLKKILND